MLTAGGGVARVARTGVPIVAVERGAVVALAIRGGAGFQTVAHIVVGAVAISIAAPLDGRMRATRSGVAGVGGADYLVVTGDGLVRADAGRRIAGVVGAGILIVTGLHVVVADVLIGVAGVDCATIAVVAVGVHVAAAPDSREAAVTRGRGARVARADVVVVADYWNAIQTLPGLHVAGLRPVAGVPVVAEGIRGAAGLDRRMHAASCSIVGCRITRIGGADHTIITGRWWHDRLTRAIHTSLLPVAVLTIVALLWRTHALAILARILKRAGVAVVACGPIALARVRARAG